MITAGIDAGMARTKAVVLLAGEPAATSIVTAGLEPVLRNAEQALALVCAEAGLSPHSLDRVGLTGAGRRNMGQTAWTPVDEAPGLCRGIERLNPECRTVLDIGAQQCLALTCDRGRPVKTRANDRCASGSGRYLEMVAELMGVDPLELGGLSLRADGYVQVESTCTVFAESEIITLLHARQPREMIVRGAHRALAERVFTLLLHVDWAREVALVGGVAGNRGFIRELEALLSAPVVTPEWADHVGAVGAALIAGDA